MRRAERGAAEHSGTGGGGADEEVLVAGAEAVYSYSPEEGRKAAYVIKGRAVIAGSFLQGVNIENISILRIGVECVVQQGWRVWQHSRAAAACNRPALPCPALRRRRREAGNCVRGAAAGGGVAR